MLLYYTFLNEVKYLIIIEFLCLTIIISDKNWNLTERDTNIVREREKKECSNIIIYLFTILRVQ